MTDTTIDTDFFRRFCADTDITECSNCGLEWGECDEIREKLNELPCRFVRRFFAEMTDEQKAWLDRAVKEKIEHKGTDK